MNWAEGIARILTHPLVAPLLLALGGLGLLFELKAGAFGLGALVSLLALGLFFGASAMTGLAGWHEILLLALGAVALALEVFVLPGHGVAGVIGLALLGVSAALALMGPTPSGGDVVQALTILGTSAVIVAAVAYAWIRHLPWSPRFQKALLRDGHAARDGYVAAPARGDLVGRVGVAVTDLRPSGTAAVGDERMDVVTEGEFVRQGTPVMVVRSEGYRHVVRGVTLAALTDGDIATGEGTSGG